MSPKVGIETVLFSSRAMIPLGKAFQRAFAGSGLALLCSLIAGRDALATDIPAIVKAAKPAVLELFCYDQDGELIKSGTGFFISADGVLLTNYHLLEGGTYRISAKTLAGKLYTSMRVLAAPDSEDPPPQEDVAELQFTDAKEVPYLSLSSAEPVEGETVVVIGNPKATWGLFLPASFRGLGIAKLLCYLQLRFHRARAAHPFLMSQVV